MSFDGVRPPMRRPSPLHGEHSREVLAEVGYAPEEIEALVAAGTVAEPEPRS
jgi:crotonobetainyl-CoA:carnitine CoA-transferase CaiB-like acyl-CoA transferase